MSPGDAPLRSIPGAAASTSSNGSQPPTARHSRRTDPATATSRAASSWRAMCRPRPSKTRSSAPHAVMSRAALAARATSAATLSSARTAARWRAAYGRSSSRSRITDASSGGTTYGSVAGNRVTRPASALRTVHANVQVMRSTPETESRTISAWCVIRATERGSGRPRAPSTTAVTRSSRNGSTIMPILTYACRVPNAPASAAAARTPSQARPTVVRPARNWVVACASDQPEATAGSDWTRDQVASHARSFLRRLR